jgi:hypothetical protein
MYRSRCLYVSIEIYRHVSIDTYRYVSVEIYRCVSIEICRCWSKYIDTYRFTYIDIYRSRYPTWTDPGVNPVLRGERPAINRLSHDTVLHESTVKMEPEEIAPEGFVSYQWPLASCETDSRLVCQEINETRSFMTVLEKLATNPRPPELDELNPCLHISSPYDKFVVYTHSEQNQPQYLITLIYFRNKSLHLSNMYPCMQNSELLRIVLTEGELWQNQRNVLF